MNFTSEQKDYLERSVLCWLATSSAENIPNVSPKEIFTWQGNQTILIANIASPQSVKNIGENENVSLSFVDIFVQKGFQMKGKAVIIPKNDPDFAALESQLTPLTGGKFPIASIIQITVESAKPILAPSYLFFPETSEEAQIKNAKKTYGC